MQRWLNGSGHAEIREENSKREKYYVEKKVRTIEVSGNNRRRGNQRRREKIV